MLAFEFASHNLIKTFLKHFNLLECLSISDNHSKEHQEFLRTHRYGMKLDLSCGYISLNFFHSL